MGWGRLLKDGIRMLQIGQIVNCNLVIVLVLRPRPRTPENFWKYAEKADPR
jgi:hypothetical protein